MNDEPLTTNQFVSRGGLKLEHAIKNFKLKIKNLVVLDVGSSTGGFVDCLLQNGASKVYSVDTSYGELAWKLRNDEKVVVMERTNILHLDSLPKQAENPERTSSEHSRTSRRVDLITIDAGWTKLELVLPIVKKFLKQDGIIIALLKPQYEADKKDLIKGVLLPEIAEKVKDEFVQSFHDSSFVILDSIKSPILGGAGNTEYLLLIKAY